MFDRVPIPDAEGCSPKNVSSYQPAPLTMPVPQQDVCTGQQRLQFYEKCAGEQSNPTDCQFWTSLNKKCHACLESGASAKAYGALVFTSGGYVANRYGCIVTLGYLGCAERLAAFEGCTDTACRDNCPPSEDGGSVMYDACRSAAAAGGCKIYSDQVQAVCPAPLGAGEGSSVALCLQSDLQTFYMAFAPILCGGGG